jgi:hypothetical protein
VIVGVYSELDGHLNSRSDALAISWCCRPLSTAKQLSLLGSPWDITNHWGNGDLFVPNFGLVWAREVAVVDEELPRIGT